MLYQDCHRPHNLLFALWKRHQRFSKYFANVAHFHMWWLEDCQIVCKWMFWVFVCGVWMCEWIYTSMGGIFCAQNPKNMQTQIYSSVIYPSQTALTTWQCSTCHLGKKNLDFIQREITWEILPLNGELRVLWCCYWSWNVLQKFLIHDPRWEHHDDAFSAL